MKRFIFSIAALIGFSTLVAANDIKDESKATDRIENGNASFFNTLSADEQVLLTDISEELEISVDDILQELDAEQVVSAVWVYDLAGNVIQSQESDVDMNLLPAEAELLMIEGSVQYYIVAQ